MLGDWFYQLWFILGALFMLTAVVTGLFIWPCLIANERRQMRIYEENQALWIEVEKVEKLILLERITQEELALGSAQTVMPEKDEDVKDEEPKPPA